MYDGCSLFFMFKGRFFMPHSVFHLQVVHSRVRRLNSAPSLKVNPLHSRSSPALLPSPSRPAKDPLNRAHLLKARRRRRSEAKALQRELRGNSLWPSKSLQRGVLARSPQVVRPSRRGQPSPLGSSHRAAPSSREAPASKVDLEEPPPSSPDLLLRAREAQEGVLLCSKSLSRRRSPVKTTLQRAALLNSSTYSIHMAVNTEEPPFSLGRFVHLTWRADCLFF